MLTDDILLVGFWIRFLICIPVVSIPVAEGLVIPSGVRIYSSSSSKVYVSLGSKNGFNNSGIRLRDIRPPFIFCSAAWFDSPLFAVTVPDADLRCKLSITFCTVLDKSDFKDISDLVLSMLVSKAGFPLVPPNTTSVFSDGFLGAGFFGVVSVLPIPSLIFVRLGITFSVPVPRLSRSPVL